MDGLAPFHNAVRTMTRTAYEIGRFYYTWHDTGAFGVNPTIFQVLSVNDKTLRVRNEDGNVVRIPHRGNYSEWTEPGQYGALTVPEPAQCPACTKPEPSAPPKTKEIEMYTNYTAVRITITALDGEVLDSFPVHHWHEPERELVRVGLTEDDLTNAETVGSPAARSGLCERIERYVRPRIDSGAQTSEKS